MCRLSMAWALRAKRVLYSNVPAQRDPVRQAVISSVASNRNAVCAVITSVRMCCAVPGVIVGFSLKKPVSVTYDPRTVV